MSDVELEGFRDPKTEAASELARRAAFLEEGVAECSGLFSIESPWVSRIWELRYRKARLRPKPVRLVRRDACRTGSLHE